MVINRDKYLNQLIHKKWNGLIKIITGRRRGRLLGLIMKPIQDCAYIPMGFSPQRHLDSFLIIPS